MNKAVPIVLILLTLLAIGIVLVSGVEMPPPLPKVYKAARTVRGAGASDLIARPKAAVAPAPRVYVLPWRYAPGASNYWWDLQSSPDLRTWTTIQTNCTGDLWVTNRGGNLMFRLIGRNTP